MKTHSKRELRLELERNAAHLAFGLVLAAFVLLAPKVVSLGAIALILVVGSVTSIAVYKRVRIPVVSVAVERLERNGVWPGKGAIALFTGVFIATAFFDRPSAFAGALSVAMCDSFSTIIGKSYGRHRLIGKKTLEGFVGGFVPTLLVLVPFAGWYTALFVALAASLTELLSPVDDNTVIPPIASAVFYYYRPA